MGVVSELGVLGSAESGGWARAANIGVVSRISAVRRDEHVENICKEVTYSRA